MSEAIIEYKATREIGDRSNIKSLQDYFGKRPGDYTIDPYYFRTGIANKPYFWDFYKRKWVMVRKGMKFTFDDNGVPVIVEETP